MSVDFLPPGDAEGEVPDMTLCVAPKKGRHVRLSGLEWEVVSQMRKTFAEKSPGVDTAPAAVGLTVLETRTVRRPPDTLMSATCKNVLVVDRDHSRAHATAEGVVGLMTFTGQALLGFVRAVYGTIEEIARKEGLRDVPKPPVDLGGIVSADPGKYPDHVLRSIVDTWGDEPQQ